MPILNWKEQIDRAIETGKHESIKGKDALCDRLNTIETLLPHHPEEFARLLKNVIGLLSHGLSMDCIQRILQRIQPIYSHAQPQDLLLVQELSRNFQALQEWSADKRWVNWFSQIDDPINAASFLRCLHAQSSMLRTLPDELIQAGLMPAPHSTNYFIIRFPMDHWSLWAKCMDLFLQLPPVGAKLLLPMMTEAMKKLEAPQKIAHLLSLSKEITKPFNQQQKELFNRWWALGLTLTDDSSPSLAKLLQMIVLLEPLEKEHPSMKELYLSMIQQGIRQVVDINALNIACQCFDVIKPLKDPWKGICYRYALENKCYFQASWFSRFERVIALVPLLTSSESEQRNILDLLIKRSDVERTFALLNRIKSMLGNVQKPPISFPNLLQELPRKTDLNQYLQSIENLFSQFYRLDERGQRHSTAILVDATRKEGLPLLKDTDFLTAMLNFDVDEPIWKTAYSLWNRSHCSSQELHEKIVFFVQIQPFLANIDPVILDNMLMNGTSSQRQTMLAHVLPKVTDKKRISKMWELIRNNPQFSDSNRVQQVIKAQALIDNFIQHPENFSLLLEFNDGAQREPRQALLSAMYHQEVTIPSNVRQSWWSQYRNALSQWIFPRSAEPLKLNQSHHIRAMRSLDRLMKGVQEIKNIAEPSADLRQTGAISNDLISTIAAYESTYSASWWKSRDRKKLATRLFQLTKAEPGRIQYTEVLNTISDVMQTIIRNDRTHSGRNKKGYSRLYDIAVQLLSMTVSEALPMDAEHKDSYIAQLKEIIRVQKNLYQSVDLDCPAFQHLQEVMTSLNRVVGDDHTLSA